MSDKSALAGLRLAVLGAGNMGGAIVRGLVEDAVLPQRVTVFDPDRRKVDELRRRTHVKAAASGRQCVSLADVVILAVKPQVLEPVAEDVAGAVGEGALVLSVAAGVPLSRLEGWFRKAVVIRAMPNMPALVGEGMSAFSIGKRATGKHRKIAEAVLDAVGECEMVPEKLLDLVTAVSGSGPAYFFLLCEKLIEAAYEQGMKVDVAKRLVYRTAFGSGKVLAATGEDPEVLIGRVASKGGTTEAALKAFQKHGFGRAVRDAVKAAHRRSVELREAR